MEVGMAEKSDTKKMAAGRDAFSSVAIWQMMTFMMLLCFVWASEFLDLPSLVFGAEKSAFNIFRAFIYSAVVIGAGIVAVGHTYEKQKAVIANMLQTCIYCHRIKTSNGKWEHVEDYFLKHYPIAINRGYCPECSDMLQAVAQTSGEPGLKS